MAPSPKSHAKDSGDPGAVGVNVTTSGAAPDVGIASNETCGGVGSAVAVATGTNDVAAAGAALTPIMSRWADTLVPALFPTVRDIAKLPGVVKVYSGFWRVLDPPSPKFQFHEVGEFSDSSVNWTVRGAVPDTEEAVKPATGITDAAVVV